MDHRPHKQNFRVSSVGGAPATSGPRVRMGRRVPDLDKRVLVDPAGDSEETLTASEFDLLKRLAEDPTRPTPIRSAPCAARAMFVPPKD